MDTSEKIYPIEKQVGLNLKLTKELNVTSKLFEGFPKKSKCGNWLNQKSILLWVFNFLSTLSQRTVCNDLFSVSFCVPFYEMNKLFCKKIFAFRLWKELKQTKKRSLFQKRILPILLEKYSKILDLNLISFPFGFDSLFDLQ